MKIHVFGMKTSILHRLRYVNRFSERLFDFPEADYPDDFYDYVGKLQEYLAKGLIDKIVIERAK